MKRWVKKISKMSTALMIGAASSVLAAPSLTLGEQGTARSIVDGDTLFLDDGLKVRLSGIQAPKLSLGRDYVTDWPLSHEAKAALSGLVAGRNLGLYYSGERRDRYERALAQVFTLSASGEQELWVQEEMVRMGMARVYTWPDTHQDSARLYRAEGEARRASRGIWGDDYYAIRKPDPDPLAQDVDSFQLVEGIVTSTAKVGSLTYLNFGANYRTDFTIALDSDGSKRFKAYGLDPLSLEGARVRVRGWIELKNGPMIWLDDPERLEVLD